jgi:hypothetical protein
MLPTFFELLFTVIDLLFDFWPLTLLVPLQNRRNGLRSLVYAWAFWAIIRVALFFNPNPINASMLLPEPLSTYLFFATGAVLVVLWQVVKAVKARKRANARSNKF